jgi:hypothetical protein
MKTCRAVIADNDRPLLDRAEVALSSWEKLRGLLGRDGLPAGEGLLLPGCYSVHTFFMRFPIDVVYLSRDNAVVKIVEDMKPYRLSFSLRGRSVLEMPAGWAAKCGLRVGHAVRFPPPESRPGP